MEDYTKNWVAMANQKQITRAHVLQRCVLRAMGAKTNNNRAEIAISMLSEAFTPSSNYNKSANGWGMWKAIELAVVETRAALFHTARNPDHVVEMTALVSSLQGVLEVLEFQGILDQIEAVARKEEPLMKHYVFIFVRTDISQEQQVVQAAHVAMLAGRIIETQVKNPRFDFFDLNFVVCGAANETELDEFQEYFDMYGVDTVSFFEPDMNNEQTAFATFPIRKRDKVPFENFHLLSYGESKLVRDLP
jgi:hypothetical protein